ncbi:hypothetical protein [Methylobacterium radiodurans]|uniref:hypothetical protein n=1 Tax=Methylobacterium radiodurans TaxID=2202828 RepID=UPI0013A5768A|nr:hypothetical protein [Methylobacterium radiodurans]
MALFWKGDDYGNSCSLLGDFRLLILGESNYSDAPIGTYDDQITQNVMKRVLAGERFTFYNKLSRLVVNGGQTWLTQTESVKFWQSVAFYNFVPMIAANKPRQRPPAQLWVGDAPRLFLEVVRELQPEGILVCGSDTWHHLPPGIPSDRRYQSSEQWWSTKEFDTGAEHPAIALPIHHPSKPGWSYGPCVPILDQLFALVAELRRHSRRPPLSLLPIGRA